jgi:hypothetical protein
MLRVYLTGRVSLAAHGHTVDEADLAGRLGRVLLARLALEPHPVDRDRLVEDLWAERPPGSVDSVLNAMFDRTRSTLNGFGVDGRAVLVSRGGTAEFRPPSGTPIDVVVAHSIARRPLLPGQPRRTPSHGGGASSKTSSACHPTANFELCSEDPDEVACTAPWCLTIRC